RPDGDGGAVAGGADRAGNEPAVVPGIVPGEAALVVRVLPEPDHEVDGFKRLPAVERRGAAVRLNLLAAPRPQIRIGERGRVVIGVAERLADRPALRLEELARAAIFLPTLRKFADANLVEPGFAVTQQDAERAPRHAEPAALAFRHRREDVVEAALLAADLIGDVAHVGQALG